MCILAISLSSARPLLAPRRSARHGTLVQDSADSSETGEDADAASSPAGAPGNPLPPTDWSRAVSTDLKRRKSRIAALGVIHRGRSRHVEAGDESKRYDGERDEYESNQRVPLLPTTVASDTLTAAVRSRRHGRGIRMAFMFTLEREDGTPADPPTLRTAVPTWRRGDTIPLGRRTLRVVDVRDDDADQAPMLVVEDCPEQPLTTDAA